MKRIFYILAYPIKQMGTALLALVFFLEAWGDVGSQNILEEDTLSKSSPFLENFKKVSEEIFCENSPGSSTNLVGLSEGIISCIGDVYDEQKRDFFENIFPFLKSDVEYINGLLPTLELGIANPELESLNLCIKNIEGIECLVNGENINKKINFPDDFDYAEIFSNLQSNSPQSCLSEKGKDMISLKFLDDERIKDMAFEGIHNKVRSEIDKIINGVSGAKESLINVLDNLPEDQGELYITTLLNSQEIRKDIVEYLYDPSSGAIANGLSRDKIIEEVEKKLNGHIYSTIKSKVDPLCEKFSSRIEFLCANPDNNQECPDVTMSSEDFDLAKRYRERAGLMNLDYNRNRSDFLEVGLCAFLKCGNAIDVLNINTRCDLIQGDSNLTKMRSSQINLLLQLNNCLDSLETQQSGGKICYSQSVNPTDFNLMFFIEFLDQILFANQALENSSKHGTDDDKTSITQNESHVHLEPSVEDSLKDLFESMLKKFKEKYSFVALLDGEFFDPNDDKILKDDLEALKSCINDIETSSCFPMRDQTLEVQDVLEEWTFDHARGNVISDLSYTSYEPACLTSWGENFKDYIEDNNVMQFTGLRMLGKNRALAKQISHCENLFSLQESLCNAETPPVPSEITNNAQNIMDSIDESLSMKNSRIDKFSCSLIQCSNFIKVLKGTEECDFRSGDRVVAAKNDLFCHRHYYCKIDPAYKTENEAYCTESNHGHVKQNSAANLLEITHWILEHELKLEPRDLAPARCPVESPAVHSSGDTSPQLNTTTYFGNQVLVEGESPQDANTTYTPLEISHELEGRAFFDVFSGDTLLDTSPSVDDIIPRSHPPEHNFSVDPEKTEISDIKEAFEKEILDVPADPSDKPLAKEAEELGEAESYSNGTSEPQDEVVTGDEFGGTIDLDGNFHTTQDRRPLSHRSDRVDLAGGDEFLPTGAFGGGETLTPRPDTPGIRALKIASETHDLVKQLSDLQRESQGLSSTDLRQDGIREEIFQIARDYEASKAAYNIAIGEYNTARDAYTRALSEATSTQTETPLITPEFDDIDPEDLLPFPELPSETEVATGDSTEKDGAVADTGDTNSTIRGNTQRSSGSGVGQSHTTPNVELVNQQTETIEYTSSVGDGETPPGGDQDIDNRLGNFLESKRDLTNMSTEDKLANADQFVIVIPEGQSKVYLRRTLLEFVEQNQPHFQLGDPFTMVIRYDSPYGVPDAAVKFYPSEGDDPNSVAYTYLGSEELISKFEGPTAGAPVSFSQYQGNPIDLVSDLALGIDRTQERGLEDLQRPPQSP